MNKIKCIAIDDEPPALHQIKEYVSRISYLELMQTFDNAIDALSYLKNNQVDLIFLDIQMDMLNGMEFIKLLEHKPSIILSTAYDSYALEAFDYEVEDYLLKPISFDRFLKATEKIYKKRNLPEKREATQRVKEQKNDEYFFVKTESRVERIDFETILYIEGLKEYLGISTTNKSKILTLQSFNNIMDILPKNNFIRVHKSFIVAINKIDSIQRNRIRIGEAYIPIGPKYKEDFFQELNRRKLI